MVRRSLVRHPGLEPADSRLSRHLRARPTSTSWKHVKLSGIDHRTYSATPLDFLVEVPWYAVFGFSLFSVRALSAAWGLVALLAWYGILLAVSDDRRVALLAVLLLACDYFFVNRAGDGRMDMMSAALAALAALAWLHWRDRNWPVAVFAANAFAAAAVFTHPNGGVLAILGIASLPSGSTANASDCAISPSPLFHT